MTIEAMDFHPAEPVRTPLEHVRTRSAVIVELFPIAPAERKRRELLERVTLTPEDFDSFLEDLEWDPKTIRDLLLVKAGQPGYEITSSSHVDPQTGREAGFLRITAPNRSNTPNRSSYTFKTADIGGDQDFIDTVTGKIR